jgi:hypothetical protein
MCYPIQTTFYNVHKTSIPINANVKKQKGSIASEHGPYSVATLQFSYIPGPMDKTIAKLSHYYKVYCTRQHTA